WRGREVPTWLRCAVLRGLEPDPRARHASMSALIGTLSRARAKGTMRALAIASAGLGSILWWATATADAGGCPAGTDPTAVYDATVRSALSRAPSRVVDA